MTTEIYKDYGFSTAENMRQERGAITAQEICSAIILQYPRARDKMQKIEQGIRSSYEMGDVE